MIICPLLPEHEVNKIITQLRIFKHLVDTEEFPERHIFDKDEYTFDDITDNKCYQCFNDQRKVFSADIATMRFYRA